MRTDGYFESCGRGRIHFCRWSPEGEPRAVLQIVHGIAEYVERYDDFTNYLCSQGYLVVAEDHMGHGKSILDVPGYFGGGWLSAVADSYHLLELTRKEFPELPYVLLGHSMGSFMARSILIKYPDSGISACILSGTGWQNRAALPFGLQICKLACRQDGEKTPNPKLDKLIFGAYNKKVEHPRTRFDWLSRDARIVDAYIDHPHCGFVATSGLMRDLLSGLIYIEKPENLQKMDRSLPVLFISGGDDPVGSYGKGVKHTAEVFKALPMKQVDVKLYPLGRHEILNEINRQEVYGDVTDWLNKVLP